MRYLSRNKVYAKIETKKEAKKVYIFCEGDKEVKYFKYFQGFSSNIDIKPIPNDNGKSDPTKLMENADYLFFGNADNEAKYNLSVDYKDEVWFVIDTDRWNEGDKIKALKDYCKTKNSESGLNQWFVVQSNPSFELWLYYHFNEIKPDNNDVQNYNSFKEYVHNKVLNGFKNGSHPVEIQSAINNSINNFEIENDQPKLYSTEVHNLGIIINGFVSEQLDKAKEIIRNQETL